MSRTVHDKPSWPATDGVVPTPTIAVRLAAYGQHIDWAARVCLAAGDDAALAAIDDAITEINFPGRQLTHAVLDRAVAAVAAMKIEPGLRADLTFYFERWRARADEVAAERERDATRRAADLEAKAQHERELAERRRQREAEYVAGLQAAAAEEDRRRGRRPAHG